MRLVTLAALAALLSLAGCLANSMPSAPVDLAKIPQALELPCEHPVSVPDKDLSTTEVARLWGRDRQSLGACRDRHAALVSAEQAVAGQSER